MEHTGSIHLRICRLAARPQSHDCNRPTSSQQGLGKQQGAMMFKTTKTKFFGGSAIVALSVSMLVGAGAMSSALALVVGGNNAPPVPNTGFNSPRPPANGTANNQAIQRAIDLVIQQKKNAVKPAPAPKPTTPPAPAPSKPPAKPPTTTGAHQPTDPNMQKPTAYVFYAPKDVKGQTPLQKDIALQKSLVQQANDYGAQASVRANQIINNSHIYPVTCNGGSCTAPFQVIVGNDTNNIKTFTIPVDKSGKPLPAAHDTLVEAGQLYATSTAAVFQQKLDQDEASLKQQQATSSSQHQAGQNIQQGGNNPAPKKQDK
jgi:hypothetical protein